MSPHLMFPLWPAALVFAASFAATVVLTRLVLAGLEHYSVLDVPNGRSSHRRPTPLGGGIGVMAAIVLAWTILGPGPAAGAPLLHWVFVGAAAGLALLSFADDHRSLSVGIRLCGQFGAVALALWAGAASGLVALVPGPDLAVYGAVAIAWVWFINLYNFMDGVDGITGIETASIGLGIAGVAGTGAIAAHTGLLGLAIAGAGAGFLVWNWHPARIFLGDVGSIPLGFLLGGLLLEIAGSGLWIAALILPLYYLADSGMTLIRRVFAGEPVWRAHRSHAYQRALGPDDSHHRITVPIAVTNMGLIVAAMMSVGQPWAALIIAVVIVFSLMRRFEASAARHKV